MKQLKTAFSPLSIFLLVFSCSNNPSGPTGKGALSIANGSSYTVYNLYIEDSTGFGVDILARNIGKGGNASVGGILPGIHAVKIRTLEGYCAVVNGISFAADSTSSLVLADSLFSQCPAGIGTLQVINSTNITIYYLFVRPWGTTTWSTDLLGTNMIGPGDGFYVNNLASGIYDARVETRDGSRFAQIIKKTVESGSIAVWIVTSM
jgi:hypothetical protein